MSLKDQSAIKDNILLNYKRDNEFYYNYMRDKFKTKNLILNLVCGLSFFVCFGYVIIKFISIINADSYYINIRTKLLLAICIVISLVSVVVRLKKVSDYSDYHRYLNDSDRTFLKQNMKCDLGECNKHARVYGDYIVSDIYSLKYEKILLDNCDGQPYHIVTSVRLGDGVVVGIGSETADNLSKDTLVDYVMLDLRALKDEYGETYTTETIARLFDLRC